MSVLETETTVVTGCHWYNDIVKKHILLVVSTYIAVTRGDGK